MSAPSAKLDTRERMGLLLTLGVVILCAGLASYIPSGPRRAYLESERAVKSAQQDLLLAFSAKQDEELRLQQQAQLAEWLAARPANFDLLAFLERTLSDAGIPRDRFTLQSRPVPRSLGDGADNLVMAQVELKRTNLSEIVDLLYAIYGNRNLVALYQLSRMGPAPDQGMECTLEFITIR